MRRREHLALLAVLLLASSFRGIEATREDSKEGNILRARFRASRLGTCSATSVVVKKIKTQLSSQRSCIQRDHDPFFDVPLNLSSAHSRSTLKHIHTVSSSHTSACKSNCTGHGTCKDGACVCYHGWKDEDCSVPMGTFFRAVSRPSLLFADKYVSIFSLSPP